MFARQHSEHGKTSRGSKPSQSVSTCYVPLQSTSPYGILPRCSSYFVHTWQPLLITSALGWLT